ncbi:hypothetical protein SDC9_91216 [bioreactor metagenome]|uniref:Uncharacterized protein n=1 Tax=bioreactor metagenome TaxID=1076179 RepID=A0A644ZVT5_9ZZZZ
MLLAALGVINDGKAVFQTKPVADFPNGKAGTTEITELALTVQRGGIIDDMVVDMRLIDMGCYKKSVAALCPTHPQLVANTVGFLRLDLARLERLAYLIGDYIIFLFPAGDGLVLPFSEKKLRVHDGGVAFIGADVFAVVCLIGIFRIVGTVCQALGNGLALVNVHGNQARGCQRKTHLPSKTAGRYKAPPPFYVSFSFFGRIRSCFLRSNASKSTAEMISSVSGRMTIICLCFSRA